MRRTVLMVVVAGAISLPTPAWAQGHGRSHGGGKPAGGGHAGQVQKQQGPAKARGAQQKPSGARGRTQTKPVEHGRAASQKRVQHGRAAVAKVSGPKRVTERRVVSRSVDRGNIRVVSRSLSGMSARERAAIGAISHAGTRGTSRDAFVLDRYDDRVRVKNRSGRVLLDMNDVRARNLGYWTVQPLSYDLNRNAPSFCRSGAGHPVWGRQWCIDKGFGLGRYRDLRWGRSTTIGDIIFGRRYYDTGSLVGDALLGLIGAVAYDRLALHAISLGYTDPLTGMWVGEPYGPRVLQLYSAGYPVAEIVDADRDDRADVLLVALRF